MNDEGTWWRSDVIFDPIQWEDMGVYTCSILGSWPSITLTAIAFVDGMFRNCLETIFYRLT